MRSPAWQLVLSEPTLPKFPRQGRPAFDRSQFLRDVVKILGHGKGVRLQAEAIRKVVDLYNKNRLTPWVGKAVKWWISLPRWRRISKS